MLQLLPARVASHNSMLPVGFCYVVLIKTRDIQPAMGHRQNIKWLIPRGIFGEQTHTNIMTAPTSSMCCCGCICLECLLPSLVGAGLISVSMLGVHCAMAAFNDMHSPPPSGQGLLLSFP